jgi:hypothetical protein
MAIAEAAMAKRVARAVEDLRATGTSMGTAVARARTNG